MRRPGTLSAQPIKAGHSNSVHHYEESATASKVHLIYDLQPESRWWDICLWKWEWCLVFTLEIHYGLVKELRRGSKNTDSYLILETFRGWCEDHTEPWKYSHRKLQVVLNWTRAFGVLDVRTLVRNQSGIAIVVVLGNRRSAHWCPWSPIFQGPSSSTTAWTSSPQTSRPRCASTPFPTPSTSSAQPTSTLSSRPAHRMASATSWVDPWWAAREPLHYCPGTPP